MVKEHLDRERGNPLPSLHGLFFSISSMGAFICTIPHTGYHIPWPSRELLFPIRSKCYFIMHRSTDRIAHNTAFSRGALAGKENCLMGQPWGDRSEYPSHHQRTLPRRYISLLARRLPPAIRSWWTH